MDLTLTRKAWGASGRVTLTGPWPFSVRRVNVDAAPVGLIWRESGTWRWSPWAPDVRGDISRAAASRDDAVRAALQKAGTLGLSVERESAAVAEVTAAEEGRSRVPAVRRVLWDGPRAA